MIDAEMKERFAFVNPTLVSKAGIGEATKENISRVIAKRLMNASRADYIFIPYNPCHTPIPGPTRLADPNRVRSARLRTGTLYLIFFLKFLKPYRYLWVWPTSYNIIQISYTYQRLPPEWCPSKSRHL